jgi:hypothetical protein
VKLPTGLIKAAKTPDQQRGGTGVPGTAPTMLRQTSDFASSNTSITAVHMSSGSTCSGYSLRSIALVLLDIMLKDVGAIWVDGVMPACGAENYVTCGKCGAKTQVFGASSAKANKHNRQQVGDWALAAATIES